MDKISDKYIFFLLIVFLLVFINYKFNGSLQHGFYYQIPQYFKNPENFTHNFFIKDSTVIFSSIFYSVLKNFNIDIYNGITSLVLHYLFSVIAIFYCFKVIKIISKNQSVSFLILICVVSSDHFILNSIRSSPIFSHTMTPSHLAHSLIFPLIFYTLKRRWIIISFLCSILILISIKLSWFPISITYLYFICYMFKTTNFNLKQLKNLFWVLIPPLITLILLYKSKLPSFTFEEKKEIFEFILWRNEGEDALHLNPIFRVLFLLITFLIFRYINNKIPKENLKLYNKILLISTVLMTLFGLIYNQFLYNYLPIPQVILLSPVRSLMLFQILFVILLINYIVLKRNFFLTIIVLIYLSSLPIIYGSFNYSLFVCVFGVMVSIILNRFFKIHTNPKHILISTFLITFCLLIVKLSLKPKFISWIGEENIYLNKKIDDDFLQSSLKIRNNIDFPLLPISNDRFNTPSDSDLIFNNIDNRACVFSKKSEYFGDGAHFYLDFNKQTEYRRRINFINILNEYLIDPSNSKCFENEILCEDVVIMGEKKLFKNLSNKFKLITVHEKYQILPLGVFKYYNIK